MTTNRYRAYRATRQAVQRSLSGDDAAFERNLLEDMAEALLLTRDGRVADADELHDQASLALSMMVRVRRLDDETAEQLLTSLAECGPVEAA
jgi:hypothetical protein